MAKQSIKPSDRRNGVAGLSTTLNDGWRKYVGNGIASYLSGTTFTLTGDKTADFTRGRLVRIYHATSAAYKYVAVVSSSYSAPTTTVTVIGDTLLNEVYTSVWVDISPVAFANLLYKLQAQMNTPAALVSGDILYLYSSSRLERLAIGNTDDVLMVQGGVPVWGATGGWIPATGETWTYSSVDDPTGVFTISGDKTAKYSAGMRLKFTNGGFTIYGIITSVAYSAPNTTVKFLHEISPTSASAGGGTAALHAMANSAITSPYYSGLKFPAGFPNDKRKWTIETTSATTLTQSSPTASTWYNVGSYAMNVPIGAWDLEYSACISNYKSNAVQAAVSVTFSTSNNSESDVQMSAFADVETAATGVGVNIAVYSPVYRSKPITLSSKTTYYILLATLVASSSALLLYGGAGTGGTITRAKCSYF